jgi:hypothetical protein
MKGYEIIKINFGTDFKYSSYLLEPEVFGQAEEFCHVDGPAESIQIQAILLGNVTNRSGLCDFLIVYSSEDPVKDTGILPKTRPEELALGEKKEFFKAFQRQLYYKGINIQL